MKNKKTKKLSISSKIAAFTMIILLSAGIGWICVLAFDRNDSLPVIGETGHTAGAFAFINQDGKQVTETLIKNKVTVVEFFFTSCPSLCPTMNGNLKEVYEKFKTNEDFVILSHTVDPERDSVPVMSNYAKRFNARTPSWQFLTGDKKKLYKSASEDYLLSAVDSGGSNFIHTQYVALLDRKQRIRGFYDMSDMKNVPKLEGDIGYLLQKDSE